MLIGKAILLQLRLVRLATGTDGEGGEGISTSSTVSFSMGQGGKELKVKNLSKNINISVPYKPNSNRSCVGDAPGAEGCDSKVECRWWDEDNATWSTDGCVAFVQADGSIGCSCNHLTEFAGIVIPTSAAELLEALQSLEVGVPIARWTYIPSV